MQRILLFVFVFMLLCTAALGNTCEEYSTKTHWISSLEMNNFWYVGGNELAWPWYFSADSQAGLVVANMSDPQAPYIAATLDVPFNPSRLWYSNDILLVGGRTADWQFWYATVDVSDPLHPVLQNTISFPEIMSGVSFNENRAIFLEYNGNIKFLYTSTPDELAFTDEWDSGHNFTAVFEYAGLTYLGNSEELIVADLSDSRNPQILNSIACGAERILARDGYLATLDNSYLSIFDVSDPIYPVKTYESDGYYQTNAMYIEDGKFIAQVGEYLEFYEISDTGQLVPTEQLTVGGDECTGIHKHNDIILYCDVGSVSPIALGDGQVVPTVVTGQEYVDPTLWDINDVEIKDNYSFVAAGQFGLLVYDFETPAEPAIVGSGFTSESMSLIAIADNLAILAGRQSLNIFDITDPTLPQIVSSTELSVGSVSSIAVHNNTIWLGHSSCNLMAVDFSNPGDPQEILVMPHDDYLESLAVSDNLLHVATDCGFYEIYSLDTMPPTRLSATELGMYGYSLDVQDNLAFVCNGWSGYSLVNFENPSTPEVIHQARMYYGVYDVELNGSHAIVTAGQCVHLMDLSNLSDPQCIGTIWERALSATTLESGEVILYGRYEYDFVIAPAPCALVSSAEDIPQISNPNLSIWPNPFNPNTTISFDLPYTAQVTIQIYDVQGRHVKTLIDGKNIDQGEHSWAWNGSDFRGRDVASGVYFARLNAGDFRITGRMVLVR